jgi:undecaprenyl-diphosphatase
MAIPVIAGGGLLEVKDLLTDAPGRTPTTTLILGGFVAMVVGVVSLLWLLRWLERGRFHWFAWWCIPMGVAVVAWQLLRG